LPSKKKPRLSPRESLAANWPQLFSPASQLQIALCLFLFLSTFLVYARVTTNGFINFDDEHYITSNEHVRAGLSWNTLIWAFSTQQEAQEANWHPLTWISHALDCELFGLDPIGHHLMNVAFHALNAVLLFLLLQRATGFPWRSLMVAALFALHPVNVESVAWVAERKNLLSMFFFLLAIAAYGWYVTRPDAKRYALLALLFAWALMAKPQVITLPFVFFLLDYWPLDRLWPSPSADVRPDWIASLRPRTFPQLVLEKLPLLLLSAMSAVLTVRAQRAGGAVRSETLYSLPVRLSNALVAYLRYLGKAVWPSHLSVMYPRPGKIFPAWQLLLAAFVLLTITAAVVAARRRRYLPVGWFWFLGMLVPMIGLIQVGDQAIADRYAYNPFIGLFVMLSWGIGEWADRKAISIQTAALAAGAVLIAFSALTFHQLYFWHDSITLWTRAITMTDGRSATAEDELAEALVSAGRREEAVPHFRAATEINPLDPIGQLSLGYEAMNQGNAAEALSRFQKVLEAQPDASVLAYARRGSASIYRHRGDNLRAAENYRAALALSPDDAESLVGLGSLALRSGDPSQAATFYDRAVAVQPTDVNYLLLADSLAHSGRQPEAEAAFRRAQQLTSDIEQARRQAASMINH